MIEKVVKKANLKDFSEIKENREYWLTKTPNERVEAVQILRKQAYGGTLPRIQKVVRVIKLSELT